MALKNRRNNPPVVKEYTEFKAPLREDFSYTCVFCGLHENELGGPRLFAVEHLKPKGKYPLLRLVYTNTLYACGICNSLKGEDWPSDNPIVDGKGYIDPCVVDYDNHFAFVDLFVMSGTSDVGRYMVRRLRLDRRQISKKLSSRAAAETTHHKTISRIDRVTELLSFVAASHPEGSKKREELEAELEAARIDRDALEAEWSARWAPQIDPEDYREH